MLLGPPPRPLDPFDRLELRPLEPPRLPLERLLSLDLLGSSSTRPSSPVLELSPLSSLSSFKELDKSTFSFVVFHLTDIWTDLQ